MYVLYATQVTFRLFGLLFLKAFHIHLIYIISSGIIETQKDG